MGVSQRIERIFKATMPGPFGLAIVLTVIAALLSLFYGKHSLSEIGEHWQRGFWDAPLMVFTLQMALILVLGYSVAISRPVDRMLQGILRNITTQGQAIITLTAMSMVFGWLNWGLGLIFGAIMARKMAESFQSRGQPFYYPLFGAAGYACMLTWHCGLSGSAPLKAVEDNHLRELAGDMITDTIPLNIPITETIFSTANLLSFVVLLIAVPTVLWIFRKKQSSISPLKPFRNENHYRIRPEGAERFEYWRIPAYGTGLAILAINAYGLWTGSISFGPNVLNSIFLSTALFAYGSIAAFFQSVRAGMDGAAAILIQFPFYFGIMGILRYGGLIDVLTNFFVQFGSAESMGNLIMSSSGLVNFFVPSGGGQWAIQGPLIISICQNTDIPLARGIMAMAYGDQLTNMLQPFWALPLLSITGLKAHQVLPYTFLMMLAGVVVYGIII
jgi:short-chain fatty acids transporter